MGNERKILSKPAAHKISAVLMSFTSVAVGVKANRNIFLNLWKNQYQTPILLKNKLTSKFTTSTTSTMSSCIFCQIVNKTAEANILHEDEKLMVFTDLRPAADHHYLVIPKVGRILFLQQGVTSDMVRNTL